MRASIRTPKGSSSATASRSATRSSATGEPTIVLLADRGRSCTPAVEGAGARTWPGTSGWSPSTRGATARSDRPDRPGGLRGTGSTSPTRSPCWTRSASTGRCWSASASAAWHALQLAGLAPGAGGRGGRDRRRRCRSAAAARDFDEHASRPLRGLGQGEPALLAGATTAAASSSSSPGVHRAALDQAARGRRRPGPGDRRRDAGADRDAAADARRPTPTPRRSAAGALPGAGRPRRRATDRQPHERCGAGRMTGGRAGDVRGRRPPAPRCATRSWSTG